MRINSFNSHYNFQELNHYITEVNGNTICILELSIDCSIDDFDAKEFKNLLVIETKEQTYVFCGYELSECYEEDGLVKVVYIK